MDDEPSEILENEFLDDSSNEIEEELVDAENEINIDNEEA